jgi:hypothetical protein
VGGGEDLVAGSNFHGAVEAGGSHEFLNAPTCLVLDVVADGHRGDNDAQVGLDGIA